MSVQVKRRREAASFLATFTGAQGELLVDTTNNRVQVHDGATPGGFPAAKLSEVPCAPSPNGAIAQLAIVETTVTLSGTSTTANISFPSNCVVLGSSYRVNTAITGVTSFNIGTAPAGTQIANELGLAVGTTAQSNEPYTFGSAASSLPIYFTPIGGAANFSAGVVRIDVLILYIQPPTS
ncbi:MAG TPA: hypothetical protein VL996_01650 [Methylocella sp.]|nr:hypothetical protein [Methylocella sp.]